MDENIQKENDNTFKVAGFFRSKEDVVCDVLKGSGYLRVKGSIKSGVVKCSGALKVSEGINANEVHAAGAIKVDKKIKTQKLRVAGYIKALEIEAEEFEFAGKAKISETINCGTLEFDVGGNSYVYSIEGSEVIISNRNGKRKYIHVNTITADLVDVTHLNCKKISGEKVIIGPRCKVDCVEYKTSIEIHPTSKVKQKIKC